MLYKTRFPSPVGELTLAGDGEALAGLWMEGQKYFPAELLEGAAPGEGLEALERAGDWLRRYFAGERPRPEELPLRPQGSRFRQLVWQALCRIPYGEVTTYGAIAAQIAAETGRRTSARAVGGAVGHNPISIIIPCHRVVGAGGSLTGYAGGLERKAFLLRLEGALPKE